MSESVTAVQPAPQIPLDWEKASTVSLRNAEIGSDDEDERPYREDWTRTTDEKDSFANKELRRNIGHIKWKNIDNYPKNKVVHAELAPNSRQQTRDGSILSVFEIGHQDGVPIPEDQGEKKEYERKQRAMSSGGLEKIEGLEDYPSLRKAEEEGRLGSVLSVFVKEHQHFDDVVVVAEPESPSQRRGSTSLPESSIGKVENYPTLAKEQRSTKEGRHGSVLGMFHDEHADIDPTGVAQPGDEDYVEPGTENRRLSGQKQYLGLENYPENAHKRTTSGSSGLKPNPNDIRDRRGSVLSLWTDGDAGSHEYDEKEYDNSDKQSTRSSISKKSRAMSNSRDTRQGSILSMFEVGKEEDWEDAIEEKE